MPARRRSRPKLGPEALQAIANRFHILSEPNRLKILCALEAGELSVTEICSATAITPANASRHLQMMTEGGVVNRRKEGLNVFYAVEDRSIFTLCENVCRSLRLRYERKGKALIDGAGI